MVMDGAGPVGPTGGQDAIDPGEHGVTAVIPCYNEQDCLPEAYRQIKAVLAGYGDHELIFVDDGSTDGTLELLRAIAADDAQVGYLSFSRNFGLEAAFTAGYRYASKPWTVQLDADLQSPPSELPKLLRVAVQGYDVVFAMRMQRRDPAWRRWGSRGQHWVADRVFGIALPYRGSIFRVVRTSVAKKIVAMDLGMPYFMATVPLIGARYTSVPTEHRPRLAGRAKWNLGRLLAHTLELYTGYSYRALIFVQLSGMLALLAGLAALVAGLAGVYAAIPLLCLLAVVAVVDLAVVSLYLMRIIRGQTRSPSMYLVRESNIPLRPADMLYEFETSMMPHHV